MKKRVTNQMNHKLPQEFTFTEVKEAIFSIKPMGSPGPDGFSAGFYQQHWQIIGDEICVAVTRVLNTNKWDSSINHTYLVLISKKKKPTQVADYRPISLCNVIYKIMSKVLANRLRIILPDIISKSQTAYVHGRYIIDNIIAAFGILHSMHSRLKGVEGYMAVKIDMSKAYYRLE